MVCDGLQPLLEKRLDVDVVKVGEFAPHDVTAGVGVSHFVGIGREGVTAGVQADAVGQVQFGAFGDLLKFMGNAFGSPGVSSLGAEHQLIILAAGDNTAQRPHGFRPQGNGSDDARLASLVAKNGFIEVDLTSLQGGTVTSAHPPVQAEQNHGEQGRASEGQEAVDLFRSEDSFGLVLPQFLLRGADEDLAELRGAFNPILMIGVVEHRDNDCPLSGVGVRAENGTKVLRVGREVIGPQIAPYARRADMLDEPLEGAAVLLVIPIATFDGGESVIKVTVRQELDGEVVTGNIDGAWTTAGVEVVFDPVVFANGLLAIPVGPEVVELPLDSLLESAIIAGLDGEALDRFNAIDLPLRHVERSVFNAVVWPQDYCQENQYNLLYNQQFGPVAQRLEQGTHKPYHHPASHAINSKIADFIGELAELHPHKRTSSIQVDYCCAASIASKMFHSISRRERDRGKA